MCLWVHSLDICTFVPGETVLSTPSDVGHCQDASQVSHIQQVGNTDHRQGGIKLYKYKQCYNINGKLDIANVAYIGIQINRIHRITYSKRETRRPTEWVQDAS